MRPTLETLLGAGSKSFRNLQTSGRCAVCGEDLLVGDQGQRVCPNDHRQGTPEAPRATLDAKAVCESVRVTKRATSQKNRAPRPATKAEAEWLAILRSKSALRVILPHPLTLIAADGDRYTPDVGEYSPACTTLYNLWEVKAGYKGPGAEQGVERFKRFREMYPWARLRLAEKRRDGWYVDGERCNVAVSGPIPAGQ
jgi:hypothetical protein